ncbi:hypothetical protein G6011_00824 [Alternaria panax]|uniref:Uncharacterized protein n=1 Tax=Alternaria panax TaxID=48097 RepID=A0AAD4IJT2_9PLEO|nr:hypothetical protein G6011_00824 [Alternaria panax]
MVVAAALAPAVSAFSVTNCETGQYKNYGANGNSGCKGFTTGNRVAYDSNKGLTLRVFGATNCQGNAVKEITQQNTCVDVGFNGLSVEVF